MPPRQPVPGIIFEPAGAVRGEIAVEIVAERRGAGGGVAVEAVGRVGAIDGIMARPSVAVIVARGAAQAVRRIVLVAPGDVARPAGEGMIEPGEPRECVGSVGRRGAVAAVEAGAPAGARTSE